MPTSQFQYKQWQINLYTPRKPGIKWIQSHCQTNREVKKSIIAVQ